MDSLPDSAGAVVYDPDDRGLHMRNMPLRPCGLGEIIVDVSMSTICRSDLHTVGGLRSPAGPTILGHEICGRVAAMGATVDTDARGRPLSIGDRITWSIAASCGRCFQCTHDLPQKCASLFKYGHREISLDPPLSGGFAEYCYLVPGTSVYRLPGDLNDEAVVFANCAVGTGAAIARQAAVGQGDAVLIYGAGLLGLSVAAMSADRGASVVAMSEIADSRLQRAHDFGATHTSNPAEQGTVADLRECTGDARGFDVVVEACGNPQVIPDAIEAARIGGTVIIAGCVYPGAAVSLDMQQIITKHLTLKGIHNYVPRDLADALEFLRASGAAFGYDSVVGPVFSLCDYEEAFEAARSGESLRVAFAP